MLIVNGHGGNATALQAAAELMRFEGRSLTVWHAASAGPRADAHAGYRETSLMLFLRPDTVRMDLAAAGAVEPLAELLDRMRAGGVAAVSPNGVLGDPRGASGAAGSRCSPGCSIGCVKWWDLSPTGPGKGPTARDLRPWSNRQPRNRHPSMLASLPEHAPGLTVEVHWIETDPAEAMVALSVAAQLVVVGTHHSADRWSIRLGPVTDRVLREAHCPVITVARFHTHSPPPLIERAVELI